MSSTDNSDYGILWWAVKKKDIKKVRKLLSVPENVKYVEERIELMELAVKNKHIKMIKLLLEHGSKVLDDYSEYKLVDFIFNHINSSSTILDLLHLIFKGKNNFQRREAYKHHKDDADKQDCVKSVFNKFLSSQLQGSLAFNSIL